MTAEQVYQKWNNEFHLEGNNGGIQKHKYYILQMMNEFGKIMCDKQKEICVDHAFAYREWGNPGIFVDKPSILNAPYPDEIL